MRCNCNYLNKSEFVFKTGRDTSGMCAGLITFYKKLILNISFCILVSLQLSGQANFPGYILTNFVNNVAVRPTSHQFADSSFITNNPALNTAWINIGSLGLGVDNSNEKLLLTWNTPILNGTGDDIIIVFNGKSSTGIASGTVNVRLFLTDGTYTTIQNIDFGTNTLISTLSPPYTFTYYNTLQNTPQTFAQPYPPEAKLIDIENFYTGGLAIKGIEFSIFTANYLDLRAVAATQNAIIVPINLSVFHGKVINGNPFLSWQTESEINANHFVIERSIDAVNFTAIGEVSRLLNNSPVKNYTFFDKQMHNNNFYFYRLKMVDNDGAFKFSQVIKIDLSETLPHFKIIRDLTNNGFTITGGKINSSFIIIDLSGRTLLKSMIKNYSTFIPTDRFPNGPYFICFEGLPQTEKIIVAH